MLATGLQSSAMCVQKEVQILTKVEDHNSFSAVCAKGLFDYMYEMTIYADC